MSEDCFPQRAGAVEIHHMHHHHILPLRLPLSVNRHGALEGDGPQPSQALVDHYPQHAARVQMRGGGRKCFKDKAAAFSCRPWQARTPPPCTNCCCCCAIIDWCCCCVWVCSVTLFLCRMNDRICSSRGEMKSELADSPPPTPTPPCGVRLEEAFSSLSCVACCHYIVQVGMRTFYNYIDKRTHGVFAPPPQNRKRIVVVGL